MPSPSFIEEAKRQLFLAAKKDQEKYGLVLGTERIDFVPKRIGGTVLDELWLSWLAPGDNGWKVDNSV